MRNFPSSHGKSCRSPRCRHRAGARPAGGPGVAEFKVDRTPYTVRYMKDGVQKVERRVPPPKLHDILPGDEVTISRRKGADWDEGDEVKVKGINPRQPNTLQVEKNGKTTFLPYFDTRFEGRPGEDVIAEDERRAEADPIGSKYLLWP